MTLSDAAAQVADSTGLAKTFIEEVYRAYWRSIREHIVALPLKEDMSDEKFFMVQANVNIPSIGKLHVPLDRYKKLRKSYKETKSKKE